METLKWTLFVSLTVLTCSLNAFADANWPNEPAGSTLLLDCGFDSTTCGGRLGDPYGSSGSSLNVVADPSAPLSPSNVLRSSLFYPNTTGGTQLGYVYPNSRINEMYVGLWWKTNPEFSGNGVGSNKLFFVRAGESPFARDFSNGVFMLRYPENHLPPGNIIFAPQYPDINAHTCGEGGLTCFSNAGNVPIYPGRWYRIEAYVKASSCPTCRDGIVRWWVTPQGGSPVLAGNYENICYGSSLDNWTWSETWDGYGNAKGFKADAHHYLDHLHISTSSGGGISIPMPQPQPGPQPAPQPAPVPVPSVGTVSDLAIVSSTSSSVNLSFTEVGDGSGAPAKYDLRVGPPGSQWGSMNSVSVGNCATPIAGSQVGAKKTCTISGLLPSTQYQFQIVAYSGVMNQGASYGGLSSAVSATTQTGSPSPAPAPAPVPAPAPNPGNPNPADSVAPQAAFVYPMSGATLTGSVLFLAQASDNVGVTELRFYINGVQLGPELKQAPYTMVVDTTKIQDGNHELSIVAKDAAGNVSAPSKIRINVSNAGVPAGSNPMIDVAGCMQTKTNQINASMSLVWLLPMLGLMRRRKKD